jgi:hypothetical protein
MSWEHDENTLGTPKKQQNPSPHSPSKEKKRTSHECILSLFIGHMKL